MSEEGTSVHLKDAKKCVWEGKINIKYPKEKSKYLNTGQDLQVTSDMSMKNRYIFLTYPEILYGFPKIWQW